MNGNEKISSNVNVKRIKMEFKKLTTTHKIEGVEIQEVSPVEWLVIINGKQKTAYEGGRFKLKVDFSKDYPFNPPHCYFKTKVYNHRVDKNDGYICEEFYCNDWSPVKGMKDVIPIFI